MCLDENSGPIIKAQISIQRLNASIFVYGLMVRLVDANLEPISNDCIRVANIWLVVSGALSVI